MVDAVVELQGVDLWLEDGASLLAGIDWTVREGEHWALLGPNGSGKSSLLSIVGARRFPSRGRVHVLGEEFGKTSMWELRERIGVIDPASPTYDWFTVEEIVLTGVTGTVQPRWDCYGPPERERAAQLLREVGSDLPLDREIKSCSQGERQRVRIARALMSDPPLLLLDEPCTGLDLPAREAMLATLAGLADSRPGMATVFVSHHLEELPPTTTHALLLREGATVASGPIDDVVTSALATACFGLPVTVARTEGRWTARAAAGWSVRGRRTALASRSGGRAGRSGPFGPGRATTCSHWWGPDCPLRWERAIRSPPRGVPIPVRSTLRHAEHLPATRATPPPGGSTTRAAAWSDVPVDLHLGRTPFVDATPPGSPPPTVGRSEGQRLLDALGINRAITTRLDLGELVGALAEACLGVCRTTRVRVYGLDATADELELLADTDGLDDERDEARRLPVAAAGSAGRAVAGRAPVATTRPASPTAEDRAVPGDLRLGGQLWLPLQVGTACVGVLMLGRAPSRRHTRREIEAGVELAGHVALTLYNAQLLSDSRRRAAEHAALFQVTQAAISSHDLEELLREVARATRDVTGWDICEIALCSHEADSLDIVATDASSGTVALSGKPGYDLRAWPTIRAVMRTGEPLHTALERVGLVRGERAALTERKVESMLVAPLTVAGEALGVVTVLSAAVRPVGLPLLTLLGEIAAQAALAVQNARFVDRTKRLALEQAALLRVSQAVISETDLDAVLAEVARVAVGLEDVEGCRILIWHRETDQFEVAAEETCEGWQTFYSLGERYPMADWPSARGVAVTQSPRGYLVTDPELSARERANHMADQIGSLHTLPINAGEICVGCLVLTSRTPRRIGPSAVRLGRELAAQAAHAIDRARLFGQLQQRAESDGLTGLLNHRAAFEALDREIAVARKVNGTLSIVVVDLDDFKYFNDTHGHLVGDRVLQEVAGVLRDCVRPRDFVARYGGDEFLIIMPQADAPAAQLVAARVVRRMARATIGIGTLQLPVRLSVGVANFPTDARNRQELIAYADSSMYAAKEQGGNQVGMVLRGTRSLEPTVIGALSGLVRAVDQKDRYTKVHSDLVAHYAVRFGEHIGLAAELLEALEIAGQLHDVGKIAVPDSILRKPGHLTPEEELMIRQHVVFSELMIKGVPHLEAVLAAVANHHERWDGRGYPNARAGEEIPLLGRIMALADALAAMTHDRPYRKGLTLDAAVAEIHAGAGSQFDPALVDRFVACVRSGAAALGDEQRRYVSNPMTPDPDHPPAVRGLTGILKARGLVAAG